MNIFHRKKKITTPVQEYAEHMHLKNNGPAPRGPHYKHTNSKGVTYMLNMKYVTLRAGGMVPIYFFSKDIRKEASPLPRGYTVRENPRNGFLTVSAENQEQHSCRDDDE